MTAIPMFVSTLAQADPAIPFRRFNEHLNESLAIENPLLHRVAKVGIFLGAGVAGLIAVAIWMVVALVAIPIFVIKALYHNSKYQSAENDEVRRIHAEQGVIAEYTIVTCSFTLIPIYGALVLLSKAIEPEQ